MNDSTQKKKKKRRDRFSARDIRKDLKRREREREREVTI